MAIIEAPEDWSGPYDEIEPDDLGYDKDEEFSDENDLLADRED